MISNLLLTTVLLQGGLGDLRRDVGFAVAPQIEVETIDGRRWYTVRAQNASAEAVLGRLAALSGRRLEGFETLDRPALLTIDLVGRPLEQVLEFALGSVNLRYELRHDAIVVVSDDSFGVEDRLNLASVAWLRAAARFPDHPSAASARMAQGEIAEVRGLLVAARDIYLTLAEDYPRTPLAGEAIMRAGRLSARRGQWAEAARLFRRLTSLETAREYHATARLELARATIEAGDPEAALHMLSVLDAKYPTADATVKTARRLVFARALNARGRNLEALEEIDQIDGDFDAYGTREALQIRAVALEGVGLPGEAARAWLILAADASGSEEVRAFEHAARLSLEDQDELAVLFVIRQAGLAGVTGLERFGREARRRLGFELAPETPVAERVTQAEAWLDDQDFDRAATVFESLFLARGALAQETSARVCVGWARCVEHAAGLDAAIEILASVRPSLESLEARRLVDVGAAALFERNNRFEDAIEAYRGRYVQP